MRVFSVLVAALAAASGLSGSGSALAGLPRSTSDGKGAAAFRTLDRYLRYSGERHLEPVAAVPFRIDAELPKLRKRGALRGLKVFTGAGRILYTQLHFVGDSLIRTAVIARFLSADTKLETGVAAAAIAPENYRLSYRGTANYNGRTAYRFSMEPRRKAVGLFKGELWIDAETARPLREWGEFVKSPSVFLRHVYFVRDYDASSADVNVRRIIVRLQAAFAGPVELTMWLDRAEPGEVAGE